MWPSAVTTHWARMSALALSIGCLSDATAQENRVLFGAISNGECIYFDSSQLHESSRFKNGFPGARTTLEGEVETESMLLSFPQVNPTETAPLRWRLNIGRVFGLIEKTHAVDVSPQFTGLVIQRLARSLISTETVDLGKENPVEWPIETDESSLEKPKFREWLAERRAPEWSSATRNIASTGSDGESQFVGGFFLLEEVGIRSFDSPVFYDFLVESSSHYTVLFVSHGCLEHWSVSQTKMEPDPEAPKLIYTSESWKRNAILWTGLTEPFRIVRAEPPIVLLTDAGRLMEYSPQQEAGEAKAESICDKVIALADYGDRSVVFRSHQFAIVPRNGPLQWTWKDHAAGHAIDDDASTEESVKVLVNLLESVRD